MTQVERFVQGWVLPSKESFGMDVERKKPQRNARTQEFKFGQRLTMTASEHISYFKIKYRLGAQSGIHFLSKKWVQILNKFPQFLLAPNTIVIY